MDNVERLDVCEVCSRTGEVVLTLKAADCLRQKSCKPEQELLVICPTCSIRVLRQLARRPYLGRLILDVARSLVKPKPPVDDAQSAARDP